MANFAKAFQSQAPQDLQNNITTFLQTAPAKTPVSVGYTVTDGAYCAMVLYTQ